jgi:hypothetical protein
VETWPHAGREALGNTKLRASAVRVAQQTPSGLRGSGSASALERARTQFNYYGPLLRLGPLQDAGELLQACSAGWFAPALGAAKLDTARVTAVVSWW